MQSPCDPPKFDQQDWSQFDFSKWNMDGLQLDSTAAAIAELAGQLLASPEWTQNFKATVPDLQNQAVAFYQEHTKQMEAEKTAAAADFDQRIAATRDQGAALSRINEAAAAPVVIAAVPNTYQIAVKVAAADGLLELSGLTVQLMDPKQQGRPLAEAVTDTGGNAVFSVPAETAKGLDNMHTAINIADQSGKVFQKVPDAACIRINQTETKVIALQDSAQIQASKAAAQEARDQRQAQAQRLNTKIDLLQKERESRLATLDCKIQQNQAIIDAIQGAPPSGSAPSGPAPSGPSAGPAPSAPAGTGPQTPPASSAPSTSTAPSTGTTGSTAAGRPTATKPETPAANPATPVKRVVAIKKDKPKK
jgi:hypothetical protein